MNTNVMRLWVSQETVCRGDFVKGQRMVTQVHKKIKRNALPNDKKDSNQGS